MLGLLDAIDGSGVRDVVSQRLQELEAPPSSAVVRLASPVKMSRAVDALADLIFGYAVPFAERYASVDAVIDALGEQGSFDLDRADHGERLHPVRLFPRSRLRGRRT